MPRLIDLTGQRFGRLIVTCRGALTQAKETTMSNVIGTEEAKYASIRARIVSHLQKINGERKEGVELWQSCEHCGRNFLSCGETICPFCEDEMSGRY